MQSYSKSLLLLILYSFGVHADDRFIHSSVVLFARELAGLAGVAD